MYAEYPGSVIIVVNGRPTRSVLATVGPYTARDDVAVNVWRLIYGVLIKLWEYRFEVVIELVVNDAAFAIVRFCGNPKEFFRFQEVASRLVTVRYVYGCVSVILEVPSAKRTPFCVLTMIDCGEDKYPTLSRIVTVLPG